MEACRDVVRMLDLEMFVGPQLGAAIRAALVWLAEIGVW